MDIAKNLLKLRGLKAVLCRTEEEARSRRPARTESPCYFFESDTSGEKPLEEFVAKGEEYVTSPFKHISLVRNRLKPRLETLKELADLDAVTEPKCKIVSLIHDVIPGFDHIETKKNLDDRR